MLTAHAFGSDDEATITRIAAITSISTTVVKTGALVGGKYRLRRRIGSGGMGTVWEAAVERPKTGQLVALKVLSKRAPTGGVSLARFEREAQLDRELCGPHFPVMYDYGTDGDIAFIVMELLRGEDLHSRLQRHLLSAWEVLSLLRALARALIEVHARGVVHRDIKTRNIFLAQEGSSEVVKLLDFGVAKQTLAEHVQLTVSGVLVGSPGFMSPEQHTDENVDARSDLWSLASVLYRCLTGRMPFDATHGHSLSRGIDVHPIPASSFPGVPSALDAFFTKAFQRHPDQRFQTAAAMTEAFERVMVEHTGPMLAAARQGRAVGTEAVTRATVRPPKL